MPDPTLVEQPGSNQRALVGGSLGEGHIPGGLMRRGRAALMKENTLIIQPKTPLDRGLTCAEGASPMERIGILTPFAL